MREILFRGKSKHDKNYWIYGGIVHQIDYYGEKVDRWFVVDGTETYDYDIGEPYEVDPATVGQYTGLTDKNGVKIFEGDILRVNEPEFIPVSGVVRFGEYDLDVGFFVEWLNDRIFYRHDIRYWVERPYCVVRGNIHDNPELLK